MDRLINMSAVLFALESYILAELFQKGLFGDQVRDCGPAVSPGAAKLLAHQEHVEGPDADDDLGTGRSLR